MTTQFFLNTSGTKTQMIGKCHSNEGYENLL